MSRAEPPDEAHDAQAPGPQVRTEGPRPGSEPTAHVVLGYRASPYGEAVLHHGADLAVRLGAALHVVHVVDLSDYPIDPDSPDWEQQAQKTLAAEQHDVESALADLPGSWTYHAAHGDPVALLRQVADHYDALMFIVGSRGESAGGVISRLLGTRPSVSHGLIARTHRPVLVIPPHAADEP
ncbi:universal stress protein [Actinomycetospora chibensis]|uniref:Universal stress protein n=1 Tax=Actinomycetospora chibensis TaxID=663606 RepID=A0ABV9RRX8_9PSEU|nr:universal stress protein [Actinomycetospora chibensis]MDD7927504.1 universal stress protein [Actinomycetospora chibensis]